MCMVDRNVDFSATFTHPKDVSQLATSFYYNPPMKLQEGNVFSRVCPSIGDGAPV